MTTYTIRSKYQTWKPWINEYNRLTMAGYSNRKAEDLADDYIEFLKYSLKCEFENAKKGAYNN